VVGGELAPTSPLSAKGWFELTVKNEDDGAIVKHILSLKPGDELECRGGARKVAVERNMKESVGIVARGLGVTAALQVIEKLLSDPRDDTEVRLVYSAK
jgi:cytochrome-b5 reductase